MQFDFRMTTDGNAQTMWVRCVNSKVAQEAKAWVECEVPLELLKPQSADVPLGGQPYTAIHIATLHYIRKLRNIWR